MLIPAGSPVQVFISLFHPLSLFAQSGSMEGGRGKKWQAKMRKQADRDAGGRLGGRRRRNRRGVCVCGGGGWRGDTPADDRLMNLWIKSASAVLWTAADNNEMSGGAEWKWRTADFGPARKFECRTEGTRANARERAGGNGESGGNAGGEPGPPPPLAFARCQRSICLLERFRSAAPKLPSRGFHSLCVCVRVCVHEPASE